MPLACHNESGAGEGDVLDGGGRCNKSGDVELDGRSMSKLPRDGNQRDYGSDAYWVRRHDRGKKRRKADDDEDDTTDEWLLSWAQLQPLLASELPRGAAIVDLGCGMSPLALDLLHDIEDDNNLRVLAVDIASGAIKHQTKLQAERLKRGEHSAHRATFAVLDVTADLDSTRQALAPCDVAVDKSTTDGLLCDVKHGAARVLLVAGDADGLAARLRAGRRVQAPQERNHGQAGVRAKSERFLWPSSARTN